MQAEDATRSRIFVRGKTTNVDAGSLVVVVCFVYIVNADRTVKVLKKTKVKNVWRERGRKGSDGGCGREEEK